MHTEAGEARPQREVAFLVVKRAVFILAVLGLSLLALFLVIGTVAATLNKDAVYFSILIKHYPATIGLPISALAALVLVFVLEYSTGPIEFEGLGFKFKGAAGPLVFWIACFLAINLSIATLWSREFHSPVADRFLEDLISRQIRDGRIERTRKRCFEQARSRSPKAPAGDIERLCAERAQAVAKDGLP